MSHCTNLMVTSGPFPYKIQTGVDLSGWENMRKDLQANGNWTPLAAEAYIQANPGDHAHRNFGQGPNLIGLLISGS